MQMLGRLTHRLITFMLIIRYYEHMLKYQLYIIVHCYLRVASPPIAAMFYPSPKRSMRLTDNSETSNK